MSTRRVGDIAEALAGEGISAATISRLNGRLSERLQEWRERPLSGAHRYLYLDGISPTVRWGGASERVSVLVAPPEFAYRWRARFWMPDSLRASASLLRRSHHLAW